ncbi:tRNA pseudouridine(13) synthase TruD [Microbulbifer bruguierae]|uniref:tRNA pseudouridine synthase D n=1 Tax=Microbulbifer bruguierae TaxID=3029061 RepID=A0ABY8NHR9_9GAMM|nr:tRNA pseudouridine(13) synthase TruD [Microbulbifer bruguierae]WGL17617.1 tRNA pseudouridine(13) synthase TruD [Microbulbifer bruguierae]
MTDISITSPAPHSRWDLDWPRALGGTAITGDFRTEPEDFVVDELAAPQAGEGEHVYLQIRKRGANTGYVAQQLARLAGVNSNDVGFFGLKDRHAVTTQWFSVWLAQKPEPNWSGIQSEEITLLQHFRGPRKLRRGEHIGNRFKITLRNVRGDLARAEQVLALIPQGVPNYFGEQRFGRDGGNLDLVDRVVAEQVAGKRQRLPRNQKGFALSAARSWLFNQVLAERVRQTNWKQPLEGESEHYSSGPLWGRGRNLAAGQQLALEEAAMAPWQGWQNWLEHNGLSQERRSLVLAPDGFRYQWHEQGLILEFALPPGTFATAVLREVAELANQSAGTIE